MILRIKAVFLYTLAFFLFTNHAYAKDLLKISAPPSIWAQKQGDRLTGPIVNLLENIFSDLDIKIRYIALPWARAIEHMKTGQIDMMPVIFYTAARAEFMDFSVPYTDVPTSIFVPIGKSFPYSSLADLSGKIGLKMRGDSISKEFKAYETNLHIMEIARYDQILRMLSTHRADYAVAAHYGFMAEAKKIGLDNRIESLPVPIATRSLHFAISKRSPFYQYLTDINKKLELLKANGTIKQMVDDTMNRGVGNFHSQ